MSIYLGLDIGSVSISLALLGDNTSREVLSAASLSGGLFLESEVKEISMEGSYVSLLLSRYVYIKGDPIKRAHQLLKSILDVLPDDHIAGMRVCGSGAALVSRLLNLNVENEFRALAHGASLLYPGFPTIFEMGGQTSKYISIGSGGNEGQSGIVDYEKSGDCAAGTGSFLDQQAVRLKYKVEEIGEIVSRAGKSAKIAGRCSVFAKSDMIHAQQKGYMPEEILKGLCEAVARNFKSSILKSKKIKTPVLFVGGVAKNKGVSEAIRDVFKLSKDELHIPSEYAWLPAVGAAATEMKMNLKTGTPDLDLLQSSSEQTSSSNSSRPLSMEKVILFRDQEKNRVQSSTKLRSCFLGVDVGSVSTNVVLLNENGQMVKEIYTRTEGRPIEVVDRCLREINKEFGATVSIQGVGTTGSGRELIGELIGSDTIKDEITAHKTGAEFIAKTLLNTRPDTIFEIGGQDSKYISIENGVVVDFAMNEACAAGTGSFLEERAEELDISIKGEFADLALASDSPLKLGERCTVFMQQDVSTQQQRGAKKEDITAGLAYSIVYNYLNRVVGRRKIGDVVFFQGGTAYNDAIASAFSMVLDKEIIVPPYNGVVGAVGAALLTREKMLETSQKTKFRGFNLNTIDYTLREFTCKSCSNFCHMQEFTVEEEKTYWGDQCSDKFRRRQLVDKKPVIEDLLNYKRKLFFREDEDSLNAKATIGLPRGMYIYENLPLWRSFFTKLGYRLVLSDESNGRIVRQGSENAVAEPCLPIQVYHGHVQQLCEKNVDWIFIPNMINAATNYMEVNSYYCPWGQTLPFVIKNASAFSSISGKILHPSLRFRDGIKSVASSLYESLKGLGETKKGVMNALEASYSEQETVFNNLMTAGSRALQVLDTNNTIGVVLVGRTYNIYDRGMTLDIGNKLRDYYGVNVIPMDFLPLDAIDVSDVNQNMYWNYGRKIIAAARFIKNRNNLHLIYLTNFKCGPDSYIKHFITQASDKPFLTLQFDGHSNDAGYITRCEAYLDSKGVL